MNIKEFANEMQAIAETLNAENDVKFCHIIMKPNGNFLGYHLDGWLDRYNRTVGKADNWKQDNHNWEIKDIHIATIQHGDRKWKRATINYNYTRI